MVRNLALYTVLLIGLCGCHKDAKIAYPVFNIRAGDTIGQGVTYVKVNKSIENAPKGTYLFKIDPAHNADFELIYYWGREDPVVYNYSLNLSSVNPTNSAYIYGDNVGYPVAMHAGDTIDDALRWETNANGFELYSIIIDPLPSQSNFYSGPWITTQNGYLGFRIVDQSNAMIYKGWIHIIRDATISDYAFVGYRY